MFRLTKWLWAGILFLLGMSMAPAGAQTRKRPTDDVREAVIRYLIERDRKNLTNKAPSDATDRQWVGPYNIIFLSIEGKDPSDAFLRRFGDAPVPVKKASQSYFKSGNSLRGMRDKESDLPGIQYQTAKITWRGNNRAELRGGYYVAGRNAGSDCFILIREKGKWRVLRVTDSVRS
jgi:hypothetical protein